MPNDEYLYAVMTDGGYIEIFDTMDEARVDFIKQLDQGEEVYLVKRGPLSWAHRQAISEALRRRGRGRRRNRKTERYRQLHDPIRWSNLGSYGWPRGRNLGGAGFSHETLHWSMAPKPKYDRLNRRPLRLGATPGHGRVIKPKSKPRKKEPKALQAYHRTHVA